MPDDMATKLADHDTILHAIDQRLLTLTESVDNLVQVTLRMTTVVAEMAVMQARQITAIDGLTAAFHALMDTMSDHIKDGHGGEQS